MSTQTASPSAANQARTFTVIAAALFLNNTVALMLGPLLVEIANDFGTSVAVTGQLAAATFLSWAIFAPLVGPFSDSFGRRLVALTGLGLMGVCIFAAAFATNFIVLIALLMATGLGGAMIPPNSMAAVSEVVSEAKKGQTIGVVQGTMQSAAVIGVPAVALLASVAGWRLPFLVCGGLLLATFACSWLWYPKESATGPRTLSYLGRFKALGSIAAFRVGMVATFSQRTAFYAVTGYIAAYLIGTFGMSVGETSLPLAAVGAGSVAGSVCGGMIASHRKRLVFAAGSALVGGAGAVIVFAVDLSIWATVSIAFGAALALSIGWPVFITFATDVAGSSRATGIGMMGASNRMGGFVGSAIGGVFLGVGGFPAVGVFCLASVGFSALVISLFMQDRSPNEALTTGHG